MSQGLCPHFLLKCHGFGMCKHLLLYLWCTCLTNFISPTFSRFFPVCLFRAFISYIPDPSIFIRFLICVEQFPQLINDLQLPKMYCFWHIIWEGVDIHTLMWYNVGSWNVCEEEYVIFRSHQDAPTGLCRPGLSKCTAKQDGINHP